MRSLYDSIDFSQMVWRSFFRVPRDAQELDTPEKLVAFLTTLARNKVATESERRLNSQQYNLNRECSIEELCDRQRDQLRDPSQNPVGTAATREQWEHTLRNQPAKCRQIIRLRLAGRTYTEMAEVLRISERTIRRYIHRLIEGMG